MKIFSAISINMKKLKYRSGKAAFLIIPITVLITLGIVISSQVSNIRASASENVFSELEEESTLISLPYRAQGMSMGSGNFQVMQSQSGFTDTDLAKILTIDHVVNANIDYTLPITQAVTSDLYTDEKISLSSLVALDSELASLYTTSDFTYTEGEPVPIILSSSVFSTTYEDWGGETSISIDMEDVREQMEAARSQMQAGEPPSFDSITSSSPVKTKALEYDKDEILGKTFTIEFGGFSDVATYEVSREQMTTTYTQLTAEERAALETERKDAISPYWNYDQLATPISVEFVVVGIIEDNSSVSTYVPTSFANKITSDLIANQVNSRTSTEIDTDLLGSTFTGVYYDGTEITTSLMTTRGNSFDGGRGPGGGMGGGFMMDMVSSEDSDSYTIPGLVIAISEEDSSVTGLSTATDILSTAAKSGETISIKIDSVANRESVVEAINDAGYAYQDMNDLGVLAELENTLNQISAGVVIAFIVITAAVVVLTMSKFVSESTKEIGIFRAIGFTRNNIITIFLSQALIYTGVGYLLGLIAGVGVNFLASGVVANWFSNFVDTTVAESVNVMGDVDTSIFTHFDLQSIGLLFGLLILITLFVALIPAIRASNVSPVEAIKSE